MAGGRILAVHVICSSRWLYPAVASVDLVSGDDGALMGSVGSSMVFSFFIFLIDL